MMSGGDCFICDVGFLKEFVEFMGFVEFIGFVEFEKIKGIN